MESSHMILGEKIWKGSQKVNGSQKEEVVPAEAPFKLPLALPTRCSCQRSAMARGSWCWGRVKQLHRPREGCFVPQVAV